MTVTSEQHSTTLLGNVAQFIRGITFKPTDLVAPSEPGAVVCMRTKNIQADLDEDDVIAVPSSFVRRPEQYLKPGDILVSSANSWELVGKCCWVPQLPYSATAGGFISILRGNTNRVRPRYLYYWLASAATQFRLRHCGRQTTNISNLDYRQAEVLSFPLPSPDDATTSLMQQDRIVAILDSADNIRRKREDAKANAKKISVAVFYDMFGDPGTNPKGWPVKRLGELCAQMRGITYSKGDARSSAGDGLVPILRAGNIDTSGLVFADLVYVPSSLVKPSQYVRKNDVVIAASSGSIDVVGKAAQARSDWHGSFGAFCKLLRPSGGAADPTYFGCFFETPFYRQAISRLAAGININNLRNEHLDEMPFIFPPMQLQGEFARKITAVRRLQDGCHRGVAEAEDLFHCLAHRAFKGEL